MRILSFLVGAFISIADLFIKRRVSKRDYNGKVIYNKGFAHNRGDKFPKVVAAVSAGLTAGIALFILSDKIGKKNVLRAVSSGLVLGGALSNSYERVTKRRVTDYIPLGKYVYNIGDFAVYAGCAGYIATELTEKRGEEDGE
ncbi:MAG: signal peptidase II [Lachnospiraceae bacterium]|nr:signal peptidase II [Lachnospiraceae bacterium]